MMVRIRKSDERGQGLVEYALILVLVAIVVIAILLQLGPAIGDTFCRVANAPVRSQLNSSALSTIRLSK